MLHKNLRCGSKYSIAQKNSYKNSMKKIPICFALILTPHMLSVVMQRDGVWFIWVLFGYFGWVGRCFVVFLPRKLPDKQNQP